MKLPKKLDTAFATYTVAEKLGEGGAGDVYHVRDLDGVSYAAKVLTPEKSNKQRLKRFKNEINFGVRHRHDAIVPVIDHGVVLVESVAHPFFIMPKASGSLRDIMDSASSKEKLRYFAQILDGVEAAHLLGTIHRDLKPENVLHFKEKGQVAVGDFGIAHIAVDDLATFVETRPQDRLANFLYAAPEQRVKGGAVGMATDIYALGLMLNEMFTGTVPQGTSYRTINAVDPDHGYLDELVEKMIRHDAGERIQSIEEVKRIMRVLGANALSMQRIGEYSKEVIGDDEIDDPLLREPLRIVAADYDDGNLTLTLSHRVNQKWVNALVNMGSYESAWGAGPEQFKFSGNRASVQISADDAQRVVDYFKTWLPKAENRYRHDLEHERREEDRRQQDELRKRLKDEQTRMNVRNNLRL